MVLSFGGQEVILLHAHMEMTIETGNEVINNFGKNPNFILNHYSPNICKPGSYGNCKVCYQ
jgi:hypothetical protein